MKVTIIPIVIGAFGTVTKGLLKGLEYLEVGSRVETIQTTASLKTARILRRVQETCCHSISSERPSTYADMKNSNVENGTHKLLWVFDIQTDHPISVRRPDLIVKLANVIESDTKAPFSIATTLRCRGVCNCFPMIASLYP